MKQPFSSCTCDCTQLIAINLTINTYTKVVSSTRIGFMYVHVGIFNLHCHVNTCVLCIHMHCLVQMSVHLSHPYYCIVLQKPNEVTAPIYHYLTRIKREMNFFNLNHKTYYCHKKNIERFQVQRTPLHVLHIF